MTEETINPKAITVMERGIKAMQKKSYKTAVTAFTSLLDKFPAERALHDRARGYLKTCERMTATAGKPPTDANQMLHLATYHLNNHEMDEALALLEKLNRKPAVKAETTYAFAIYHALNGDAETALTTLAEAIKLNETCKFAARTERDFGGLFELPEFQELMA